VALLPCSGDARVVLLIETSSQVHRGHCNWLGIEVQSARIETESWYLLLLKCQTAGSIPCRSISSSPDWLCSSLSPIVRMRDRGARCNGNDIDLYSEGTRFESPLHYWLSLPRFLVFLLSLQANVRIVSSKRPWRTPSSKSLPIHHLSLIRGLIQKFPDWPPGAIAANVTALCH
jgi:hypothetical protein